jgi:hypothetical protein
MPTTDTTTPLGVLHAFGYHLRVKFRQGNNGTKHFVIAALGGHHADAPLGEVGLTSRGLLCPALNRDAEHIDFGLTAPGGEVLMRFLVDISAALDGGDVLSSEWDFTPDPGSPLARRTETAGVST